MPEKLLMWPAVSKRWRSEPKAASKTKVIIQDGRVVKLSKSVSRDYYSGTFANIARFSYRGARRRSAKIESMLQEGRVDQFYNDALGQLSAEGSKVGFTETDGLPWVEIDDANDFHYAQTMVYPALKPMMADMEPIEMEFQTASLVSTGALV